MTGILEHLIHYLNGLDWSYILSFIILAHGLNHKHAKHVFYGLFRISIMTRYRVVIIGLCYGIALYFIRGYQLEKIESLLQSFVFAVVFHKMLLEKFLKQLFDAKSNTDE